MNAATFRAVRETCGIPQSAVEVALESYEEALGGIEDEVGELDGIPPCALTYWRTQGEYDRHGRDPGSHSVVNARVRDVATGLREMGVEVEFAYWDEGAVRTPGSRY